MQATGRPVSPHVTIYAFPIAAISSITNRVTGITLSLGAAGLGAAEIFGGSGSALSLMQTAGSSGMILTAAAKFSVAFPNVYHYAGALRHLAWDSNPESLTLPGIEKSSYYLFGGSLALSAGLSIFV
jgi:succinate dehydrogenase (ubiquinone) cytochrome b560 subunit